MSPVRKPPIKMANIFTLFVIFLNVSRIISGSTSVRPPPLLPEHFPVKESSYNSTLRSLAADSLINNAKRILFNKKAFEKYSRTESTSPPMPAEAHCVSTSN
jgi:hypothetical protein